MPTTDTTPAAWADIPATALIVVAAGAGTRMRSDTRKPYLQVQGQPVLFHTLARFRGLPFVRERYVMVAPEDVAAVRERWPELERDYGVTAVLPGGAERVYSVRNGLDACGSRDSAVTLVAVHDGVRPLVDPARVATACRLAAQHGGAILAAPVSDTLKREQPSPAPRIAETVPRAGLWAAQTPQVFQLALLRAAFAAWAAAGEPPVTDDAALVERIGGHVALVESERSNLKLTTPDDLVLAEALLAAHQR